jgi:biotin--protein ligase
LRDEEGLERLVKVSGLTSTGYLSAEAVDNGEKFELHPDGNSLDFFAGLIAKKHIS